MAADHAKAGSLASGANNFRGNPAPPVRVRVAPHWCSRLATDLASTRRMLGASAMTIRSALAVRVADCVEAPARRGIGGRFGGACPSHARCAECCSPRRVVDGPRPSGRGRASIRGQMKSVGYLDGIGRALPSTFGVRASTVADDDLDARVTAHRGHQAPRAAATALRCGAALLPHGI